MRTSDLCLVILVGAAISAALLLGVGRAEQAVRPDDPRLTADPHGIGLEAGRAARAGVDPLRPPGLPAGAAIDPQTGFLTGLELALGEGERLLAWGDLAALNDISRVSEIPPALARLDGQVVVMAGFLMPLYKLRDIDEFAFVGSHYTCCFQRPPGLGDQIIVKLAAGAARLQLTVKPLRVRGVLRVRPQHWFESGRGPLISVLEIEEAHAAPL